MNEEIVKIVKKHFYRSHARPHKICFIAFLCFFEKDGKIYRAGEMLCGDEHKKCIGYKWAFDLIEHGYKLIAVYSSREWWWYKREYNMQGEYEDEYGRAYTEKHYTGYDELCEFVDGRIARLRYSVNADSDEIIIHIDENWHLFEKLYNNSRLKIERAGRKPCTLAGREKPAIKEEVVKMDKHTKVVYNDRCKEIAGKLYCDLEKKLLLNDVVKIIKNEYALDVSSFIVSNWIDKYIKKNLRRLTQSQKQMLLIKRIVEGHGQISLDMVKKVKEKWGYKVTHVKMVELVLSYKKINDKKEEIIKMVNNGIKTPYIAEYFKVNKHMLMLMLEKGILNEKEEQ